MAKKIFIEESEIDTRPSTLGTGMIALRRPFFLHNQNVLRRGMRP